MSDAAKRIADPLPLGAGALCGLVAGFVVGLLDGARAAGAGDGGALLGAALLAAGGDALVGLALGVAGEILVRLRAWGGNGGTFRAEIGAALLLGLVPAAVAVLAVAATAGRVNRFLAAGVVVTGVVVAAAAVALVAPLLARALKPGDPRKRPAARWLLHPLAWWPVVSGVFLLVWRTRAPVRGSLLLEREALAGVAAGLLPLVTTLTGRLSARVRLARPAAMAIGLLVCLAPVVGVVAARWQSDFQYLPWTDVVVVLAICVLGGGLALAWSRRARGAVQLRVAGALALGGVLAAACVLRASSSEAARKAVTARAGVTGPLLAQARALVDLDHDGYPRILGGGDCNDQDAAINPAALDWPEDGIDQDCDGADATLGSLASPAFHPVPAGLPAQLNVLFVAVDTLRADHLGCYGYKRPTSPEIDQVAAQGVLFENGWAHAPSTRYSMPAIATSRWPSAIPFEDCTGCQSWWPRLGPVRTLGEAMKATGAFTAAFYAYSYFNKSERRGFERGIDDYQDQRAALHTNVAGPAESIGSSAREITDDAIAFYDRHPTDKTFLWLHYYDPHLNYMRHPEVPDFGSAPADLYDNEIRFTDMQFGRLVAHLRARGLWDRTVVVLTGDHGEGLGERGVDAHGYHLYPPQTKVPFVVRVPGLAPRRVTVPVSHVDLAPTLVNLVGGAHEPSFLGRSFVDLLVTGQADATLAPTAVFQEVSYENDNKKRALVTATHQLIWNWTPHNTTECYELARGVNDGPDLWGRSSGEPVCSQLKADLRRQLALLSLPPDYRDKVGFGVAAPGVPGPAHAAQPAVQLGDAVRYLGFDGPTSVARGEPLEFVWHFQVLRPLAGWRTFFHLQGPAGYRNLDHVPVEGTHPVERWKAGQLIRDRHRFTIEPGAPPGRYEMLLGFWKGNERLPVAPAEAADADRRVRAVVLDVR